MKKIGLNILAAAVFLLLCAASFGKARAASGDLGINSPGIQVSSGTVDNTWYESVVVDDAGSTIVVWIDYNTDLLYAQKLDSSGNKQWTPSTGVAVGAAYDFTPFAEDDGSGGVVIGYHDATSYFKLARVNSSGTVVYSNIAPNKTAAGSPQYELAAMAGDGAGGAFVLWGTSVANGNDIYFQHVDGTGAYVLASDLLLKNHNTDVGSYVVDDQVKFDGTCAYASYGTKTSGTDYGYLARICDGTKDWEQIYTNQYLTDWDHNSQLLVDGSGGVFIAYMDEGITPSNNTWSLLAKYYNSAGVNQWDIGGVNINNKFEATLNITPTIDNRYYTRHQKIISDGSGGIIVAWVDWDDFTKIYIQRVNSSGTLLYTANGKTLVTVTDTAGSAYPIVDIFKTSDGFYLTYSYIFDASYVNKAHINRYDLNADAVWNSSVELQMNSTPAATDYENIAHIAGVVDDVLYLAATKDNVATAADVYFQKANTLTITPEAANCTIYESTDVPKTILSTGSNTATSNIVIAGSAIVQSLQLRNVRGTHTFVGDLVFSLASPNSTSVGVAYLDMICSDEQNFYFDLSDDSVTPLVCPPTGRIAYQPDEPLSAFVGENALGTWVLSVFDDYNGDGGSLEGWALEICTAAAASPTPSPVDATTPNFPDLGPGMADNFYTRELFPTFRWKTYSASQVSNYKLTVETGYSSLNIEGIDRFGIGTQTTSKYTYQFENTSDSDQTNNQVAAHFSSSSDWSSSEHNGEMKEGKRKWTVTSTNNSNRTNSSSRNVFVDLTAPELGLIQISGYSSIAANTYYLTDTTPTITGRLIDRLAGETDNKIASGPRKVTITINKYLDDEKLTSEEVFKHEITIDDAYWLGGTEAGKKISDNSQNLSDKYADFSYQLADALSFGNYQLVITGLDRVENSTQYTTTFEVLSITRLLNPTEIADIKQLIQDETGTDEEISDDILDELGEDLEIVSDSPRSGDSSNENIIEQVRKQITEYKPPAPLTAAIKSVKNLFDPNTREGQVLATAVEVTADVTTTNAAAVATVAVPSVSMLAIIWQTTRELSGKALLRGLQAIGLFPQARLSGIVFDSLSQLPVPFAILEIRKENFARETKLVERLVTDQKGAFPELKIPNGNYWVKMIHQSYRFPSAQTRPIYLGVNEFYKGELVQVNSRQLPTLFVPTDPGDQPTDKKNRSLKIKQFLSRISLYHLMIPAFIVSAYVTFLYPTFSNFGILFLYIVSSIKMAMDHSAMRELTGQVVERGGQALFGVIVKVMNPAGQIVAIEITDKQGKFKTKVAQGKYSTTLVKNGYTPAPASGFSFEEIDLMKKSGAHLALEMVSQSEAANYASWL